MITFTRMGYHGHLGNQLFQYSLLQAVMAKTGYEMAIPKRYYGARNHGFVELEPFCITAPELPADFVPTNVYRENHQYEFSAHPDIFDQPDGTDFEGYFQSELYFKDIEPTIRKELAFKPRWAEYADDYIARVRCAAGDAPIVSLHNRRGDYLNFPDAYSILSVNWFHEAYARMESLAQVVAPAVLIFSDDIEWCQARLQLPGQTFYCQSDSHWHDLAIMSRCDHHIISASTFGWWGAWLNPNPGKKVIAPDPWFQPGAGIDFSTIVPEGWEKLPFTRPA